MKRRRRGSSLTETEEGEDTADRCKESADSVSNNVIKQKRKVPGASAAAQRGKAKTDETSTASTKSTVGHSVEDKVTTEADMEAEMQRLLGFSSFGSTQGKAVEDNQTGPSKGHAKINKVREYKQYLNKDPAKNKR
jgi:hypothetical protein